MDLYTELMRIAKTIEDKKDANIVRQAAIKHLPEPKPVYEKSTYVPGYGHVVHKSY